jgi:hypothetical protein
MAGFEVIIYGRFWVIAEGHSFLRPTTDNPAQPQGRLPRRAGRKVDFCLACPSLSSSLICCSCKR